MLGLRFAEGVGRPDKNNIIDIYLSDECEDVLGDDVWKQYFAERPAPFTKEEQKEYLSKITGVSLGSDAFFPFSDNIERARKSGVSYVAQPGGSVRDDLVIEACDKYGMVMAFTGMRLFHRRCAMRFVKRACRKSFWQGALKTAKFRFIINLTSGFAGAACGAARQIYYKNF